jgi:ADP-ribose pyrophosphatase YjhB (NUDIX family)
MGFSCGKERMTAKVEVTPDVSDGFRVTDSGGLAFDHAKIIACAVLKALNINKSKFLKKEYSTEEEYLENYDPRNYDTQSMCVDAAVFAISVITRENYRKLKERLLKLLLIKRANHPDKEKWALPGGFKGKLSLEEAVYDVLKKKTNVDDIYLEQLYTWSDPDRDKRMDIVSSSFLALINENAADVQAGARTEEAKWFGISSRQDGNVTEITLTGDTEVITLKVEILKNPRGGRSKYTVIDSGGLAFDHAKIIACALKELRDKIWSTDLAFKLLPEEFTLTELQQVYEMVLGRELLTAAFRRKMESRVEETGRTTAPAGHRPAKLYRAVSDSE